MENKTLEILSQNINTISLQETTGNITRDYVLIPVQTKDENGNKITVMRKCRNELAVNSLATIDVLTQVRGKSLKMIVLGMAKITDEHAKSVDKSLKSAKALIHAKFPEYSENTIQKYRNIGLLFSNNVNDSADFSYIGFIDEDISISNLDVVLTLIKLESIEKASVEERQKAVADFYDKYIATDRIHLSKSQNDLKDEVRKILNPDITVEGKVIDEKTEDGQTEDGQTEETEETEEEVQKEQAQYSIEHLKVIFTGNKKAEKAIAILMEELSKLF